MFKPIFRRSFLATNGIEYYAPARRGKDYCLSPSFFAAGGRAVVVDADRFSTRLIARSRQFDTVTALHQIREAFTERDYTATGKRLMMGFPTLWWRLGRYVLRTILTETLHSRDLTPAAIRRLWPGLSETAYG